MRSSGKHTYTQALLQDHAWLAWRCCKTLHGLPGANGGGSRNTVAATVAGQVRDTRKQEQSTTGQEHQDTHQQPLTCVAWWSCRVGWLNCCASRGDTGSRRLCSVQ